MTTPTQQNAPKCGKSAPYQVALIGNPNCGKTTLFNRLTGSQQTTGNWPGVTVEQKIGHFRLNNTACQLIDLPGVYSLETSSHSGLDEKVAREFLQHQPADMILNVVDATSLERQLFLTAQLLHMGLPVVVVLNRMDLLKQRHLNIDIDALSAKIGCPVIPVSAYFNQGIDKLKQSMPKLMNKASKLHFDLPEALHHSVHAVRNRQNDTSESCWKTLQTLIKPNSAPEALKTFAQAEKTKLETHFNEDLALIAADLYFQFAHDASHSSLKHTDKFTRNTTDLIDKWVLHPLWGMPIFLSVMYLVFAFSIGLGNAFLDLFDLGAQALFVDGPTALLQSVQAPDWLIALLATGLGGGLQVVATFIPIIGALFLFLSLLEETGYMQRAALIMDRSLRSLGLSGQAFIPLVVGFGCNVPSVLATRTLPDQRDRIMTIMMAPFMSCSARLTVYVLFAAAFFADHAALLVFSLYLIGILAAIITALVLKTTLLPGQAPPLLMELPIYNKPAFINVILNTKNKLKGFVLDAGKIIVLIVLILNMLNSVGTDGSFGNENQEISVLSSVAKSVTPLVEPLGITEENWPATVGLITGLLAKEVVVGALDSLYSSLDNNEEKEQKTYQFGQAIAEAFATIPTNFANLANSLMDPLGLQSIQSADNKADIVKELDVSESTLQKMTTHFNSEVAAYAYLLLVLLYFPCVATLGVIKQELGWRWMSYSAGWSLFLGYTTAVAFYQLASFSDQPQTASIWLLSIVLSYGLLFFLLKKLGKSAIGTSQKNYDSTSPKTLY